MTGDRRFDAELQMTDAEGLMWRLEKDPFLSSTFANVSLLDRSPDFDELKRRMDRARWVIPRLRQRVQPAPVNLQAPLWVDDTGFDIDYHVRRIALPQPGTLRQLFDLCTTIVTDPLDRSRPLWQLIVVEGVKGGKAALITKMHHTVSDGENGIRMSLEFTDFERHPPPRPPVTVETIVGGDGGTAGDRSADARSSTDQTAGGAGGEASVNGTYTYGSPASAGSWASLDVSGLAALRDIVAGGLRLPLAVGRQVRELLADPTRIPGASQAALETMRSIVSQLSDLDKARSPLWVDRTLKRRFEVASAPLDATKEAAKRLGGTLNTAFLTAAAEAAGAYHRELGAPVDELRASMVISTRTDDSGANAFTLARMLVPTGEMDIADRFEAINEAADAAKRGSASASLEMLAVFTTTLPTSLVTRLARQQAQTVDFATSNIRGAPMAMYIGGAKVLHNYPMGPLTGVAFNLTLMSYIRSLDMGINIDAGAVAHPARLRRHLEQAFKRLVRDSPRSPTTT